TIDEWLTYAPAESLALYMFTSPRKAKKLYFDVIPQQVDDYLTHLEKYNTTDDATKLENPCWHIHAGRPPAPESSIRFSLLLNLVSACNAEDKSVLWGFLKRELPDATPHNSPMLDQLCGYAVRYYHDFVKPTKQFRAASELERRAMGELRQYLVEIVYGAPSPNSPPEGESKRSFSVSVGGDGTKDTPHQNLRKGFGSPSGGEQAAATTAHASTTAEDIQTRIYEIGMAHYGKENLRDWFKANYELLLGQSQGPRMGSFIHLFGAKETISLIDAALLRQQAA
ncbi:MAG: hypothetical protein ACK5R4_04240, partial [Alphaproteobacteria bacterium]